MMIDNSLLSSFAKCHIDGAIRYWFHLQSKQSSINLELGHFSHALMQGQLNGNNLFNIVELWKDKFNTFFNQQPEYKRFEDETMLRFFSLPELIMENFPIVKTSKGVVVLHKITKAPKWRVRYTEIPFKFPLNENHTYIGRFDGILEDEFNNWDILELKNSRWAGSKVWQEKWRLSTQPIGYVWAAQQHTLSPIRGAILTPFNLSGKRCSAEQSIDLQYSQHQVEQWKNDTITFCDLLTDIAEFVGIEFNSDGRAIAPSEKITDKHIHILKQLLPTGRYCGNCSSTAFGKCSQYSICVSNYAKGYLINDTEFRIWKPETIEEGGEE